MRALDYPFGIPRGSYLLDAGRPLDWRGEVPAGRVAVLAFGANASPARLAAKLGDMAASARVPVVAGELAGFDVVYSAHVSPYGAIPGTLLPCPGAVASVHVIHLTEAELARVHSTEPNYDFVELDEGLSAYMSKHGALRRNGAPVGVAAIPVRDRVWPALDERGILAAVRDDLAPGVALEDFVAAQATDPEVAAQRTRTLRATAIPFDAAAVA
ncbi:MAG: hypothetical protein QOE65_2067 [Solirubrobacteraceae bacterium]|jgi:hypothetical protein|nr:hypothetical protein [Solirubrobacteraceae bacterium]